MIIDSIHNASSYYGLGTGLASALKWLSETDLASLDLGRHELCCGKYALVMEYDTAAEDGTEYEAHRKYIDVQYIVSGREKIGYALLDSLKTSKEYSSENDAEFFEGSGSFLTLNESSFMIFMPQDAHMPGLSDGQVSRARKVVVKVPVE